MSAESSLIDEYMNSDEEISYSLSHRPTGFFNWLKAAFGYGITHWYVTNQRIVEHQTIAGGFRTQDLALDKVASVEYGRRLNLGAVALGVVLAVLSLGAFTVEPTAGMLLGGLAALLFLYAILRKPQVLAIHGSGGVTLALAISKGDEVDEILWYVNAVRQTTD